MRPDAGDRASQAGVDGAMSVTGREEPGGTDAGLAVGGAKAATGTDPVVLELYQLAVEMADRVSARRGLANTFFLTLNTGLAALLGANNLRWYVAAAGIVFAGAWWWQLRSYRRLSAAKFEVINAIEPRLPLQLFSDEWRYLQRARSPGWPRFLSAFKGWLAGYHELGGSKRVVPLAFVAIYVAELIRQVTN
jgi:hypothetical protein